MFHFQLMQPLKLFKTNSESKIKENYQKLFFKKYATYALPRALIGNPRTNVLARLSDMVEQRSRALDIVAKRHIEFFNKLNLTNFFLKGDLQTH